jgi:NOL1/NOP2/fmu family ribosome biogenesis protein
MKPTIIILNSKDRKVIKQFLEEEFGVSQLPEKTFFCLNKKEKVYITNKEVFDVDHDALRVNAFGNYFGMFMPDGFRLSIEGSQFVGPLATKNVVELSEADRDRWMKGENLETDFKPEGKYSYVIIKHKNDFYSTGKVKNEEIINYVSKSRKLKKIFSALPEDID